MKKHVSHTYSSNPRLKGFTVIELMVVLVILVVLIALAAPSMRTFIVSNRLTSQANDLIASLSLARSEAAARGINVSVCAAAGAATCASSGVSDWNVGYIVWVDTNNNSSIDSGETILKYTPALEGSSTLAASFSTSKLAYRAWGGIVGNAALTFTLCSPGMTNGRQISVPITGRAMVTKITTCS